MRKFHKIYENSTGFWFTECGDNKNNFETDDWSKVNCKSCLKKRPVETNSAPAAREKKEGK